MIRITNLSFSYGDEPLYEKVNFIIGDNQKIGLVGPNGSGKTTLLNIVAGKLNQSDGKVNVEGSIGIVPQEIKRDPEMEKGMQDEMNNENLGEEKAITGNVIFG